MPATARRRSSDTCNIKVAVRVRGGCEGAGPSNLRVDGNELLVQSGQPSAFAFDHCYGPEATQPEVYDDVGRKVLDAAFEGYNGTIFAYGQTGSGKTYTLTGGVSAYSERGIIPRTLSEVFRAVAASEQQLHLYKNLLTRDAKRAAKLEKKLELTLGGYRKRSAALVTRCQTARNQISEKQIELSCFEKLATQEGLARMQRLSSLEAFVKEQREREATLQEQYSELSRLRLTLQESMPK